jgi:hypothetical protein
VFSGAAWESWVRRFVRIVRASSWAGVKVIWAVWLAWRVRSGNVDIAGVLELAVAEDI